jgi:Tol biopolymer transport system component
LADIESLLRDGIAAVKKGDRATARTLLTRVVEQDADNEKAWMWLAATSTNPDERREFLLKVLAINPSNERAQQAIASLAMQSTPEPIQETPVQPEPVKATPKPEPAQKAQPTRKASSAQDDLRSASGQKKSSFNVRGAIIGVLVLVLLGALVFFGITLKNLLDKQNAPVSIADAGDEAGAPPPTFTLPPLPTETPIPIQIADGTMISATLPPTYTPTPEPTATATLTPTATPISQQEFLILFTLLEDDAQAPALYSMDGDGTNVQRLETNIRDIAFDPTGTQIAFIRDVLIPDATGDRVLLPQIFVAPFDNLSQATQITEQYGTTLSHPSWSPEGQEIVFVSNQDSEFEDLWVINVNTRRSYRLTSSESNAYHPSWRPILGSREVVYTYEGTLGLEINKLDVREAGEDYQIRRIANQINSYSPSWNINGQRIVFLSDRQIDADVYHMDGNGSDQRLVTRDDNGAEDRSPHFSPDGRFITFVSNRLDGRFNIYMSTPDGNSLTRLTEYRDADVIQLIYRPELFFRLSN